MGVDKARIPVPGRWPMAVHVAGVLRRAGLQVALVRRGPSDGLPWRWPDGGAVSVVREPVQGEVHPLWGVAAALEDAEAHGDTAAVVVPCDVPGLTVDVVRALVDRGAPAVAEGARRHPLVACLPVSMGGRARELAASGAPSRALTAEAPGVPVPEDALRNVNRWSDAGVEHPVQALLDGLPWLDEAARERVAAGERARLAARGVVVPPAA